MKNIAVFGAGYVGLVAGACLAEAGNRVWCIDSDPQKIAALQEGKIPIYEEGLAELVARCTRKKRLRFCTEGRFALKQAEVVFVAVGTPSKADGSADLSAVFEVARLVAKSSSDSVLLVLKSTVPVGTNAKVSELLEELGAHHVEVVSNPEFLKEGAAIHDFRRPDRVVLGLRSEGAAKLMRQLYEPFVRTGAPILCMDPASAELCKYASNAMLATRISFMNAIAALCESVGADVEMVRQGVGSDKRIGPTFLFAGIGYGGSCFPKDLRALLSTARDWGTPLGILEEVERVNEAQKALLLAKIDEAFRLQGGVAGKTLALWGLSFKPNTDDIRESPALTLLQGLFARGAKVVAHDPVAAPGVARLFAKELGSGALKLVNDSREAAEGAHALVVATEWAEYRRPDFARLRAALQQAWIFDGRNLWNPASMAALGFSYFSVGRPGASPDSAAQAPGAETQSFLQGKCAPALLSISTKASSSRPEKPRFGLQADGLMAASTAEKRGRFGLPLSGFENPHKALRSGGEEKDPGLGAAKTAPPLRAVASASRSSENRASSTAAKRASGSSVSRSASCSDSEGKSLQVAATSKGKG